MDLAIEQNLKQLSEESTDRQLRSSVKMNVTKTGESKNDKNRSSAPIDGNSIGLLLPLDDLEDDIIVEGSPTASQRVFNEVKFLISSLAIYMNIVKTSYFYNFVSYYTASFAH